jgi:hypothetical protein
VGPSDPVQIHLKKAHLEKYANDIISCFSSYFPNQMFARSQLHFLATSILTQPSQLNTFPDKKNLKIQKILYVRKFSDLRIAELRCRSSTFGEIT